MRAFEGFWRYMCDDRRRMRALGLLMGGTGVEGWIGRFVSSCSEKTDDVGPVERDGVGWVR